MALTLSNVAIVVALAWLLAIFLGRLREPRVRIICPTPTNPEEPDLDLSTTVAREFSLVRQGSRPQLAVVEAVDREVDLPAAVLPAAGTGFNPVAFLGGLLRRTYRLEIRYEADDPADLVAVARLYSALGRLLSSEVIKESSFLVLRREPGLPPFGPTAPFPSQPTAPSTTDDTKAPDTPAKTGMATSTANPEPGGSDGVVLSNADEARARKRRLGVAIAAWGTYELLLSRSNHELVLLTRDWRSYALFRFGVEWSSRGSVEHARRAYREALDIDPFNRGALFNLGVVEAARGCHAAAFALLDSARAETVRVSRGIPGARSTDPLWYRAVYNIGAVHQHHRSSRRSVDAECQLDDEQTTFQTARADLQAMIRSSARTMLAIERRRGSRTWLRSQWLVGFLRMTQAASVVLLAMMVRDDAWPGPRG